MDYKNFQKILIEKALAAGFSDCEVYYKGSKHFEVMIMEGEVFRLRKQRIAGDFFQGHMAGTDRLCLYGKTDRAGGGLSGGSGKGRRPKRHRLRKGCLWRRRKQCGYADHRSEKQRN